MLKNLSKRTENAESFNTNCKSLLADEYLGVHSWGTLNHVWTFQMYGLRVKKVMNMKIKVLGWKQF